MAGRAGAWYLDGQILLTLGVGATSGRSRKPVSRTGTVRAIFARAGAPACTRQSAVGTAVAGACDAGDRARTFPRFFVGGPLAGFAAARPRHRAVRFRGRARCIGVAVAHRAYSQYPGW